MNIVITGGTSGLGKELTLKFKNQGHNIIVLARSVDEKDGIKCDLSNENDIKKAFKEIGEKFDKIDLLLNNAGYGISGATELISALEARRIFDVNFFGTLFCIQNALPLMRKGGKIINISSVCAFFPLPFRTLYCASKSAVSMFTNCLNMELKNANVQVSAICPGDIKTSFTKNRVKNFETNERYGNRIKSATDNIDKNESKRMSVQYASCKVFKIINKKKLKPQYIIGKKYKFLYILYKIFPLNWFIKATNKFKGGKY
ncbi:MAG: SDR family NAD(P)-dependent oxidoreductase [Clostridia bacterium]|nr:SDR family NAD(P)-dependent oxidoreductase [Clostridia bacterium]MDD4685795.1 SDR family NAD(P)-dependent oxidoreductase [Clostridia bacterium]